MHLFHALLLLISVSLSSDFCNLVINEHTNFVHKYAGAFNSVIVYIFLLTFRIHCQKHVEY